MDWLRRMSLRLGESPGKPENELDERERRDDQTGGFDFHLHPLLYHVSDGTTVTSLQTLGHNGQHSFFNVKRERGGTTHAQVDTQPNDASSSCKHAPPDLSGCAVVTNAWLPESQLQKCCVPMHKTLWVLD